MARIVEVFEGRIQLPKEWLERWNNPAQLVIEEFDARLMIQPVARLSWEHVFRNKLRASTTTESEEVQVERSDLFL